MMKIYFVRHGQTDWNVETRLQGQIDIPINSNGRNQARRNGGVLAELIDDPQDWHFVSSPLCRTRETMEIIRETMGLNIDGYDTDDRLKEVHFGNFQSHKWSEVKVDMPEAYEAREKDKWGYIAPGPGGESYEMLFLRTRAWIESITQNTICVSHGGVNRCLRKYVENLTPEETTLLATPQDKIMAIENQKIEWI